MPLLTGELKTWIGKEVRYPAREPLGKASIRYFALALGDPNPLYQDEAYAQAAGYRSIIAPPTLVCETCQYAHQDPDRDGYIGHEWRLPLAHCRLVRAGNEYEFYQPVYPDDEISVTFRLDSIEERSWSRGGTQLFVTSLARYFNQRDELLASNREITVVQPLAPNNLPSQR